MTIEQQSLDGDRFTKDYMGKEEEKTLGQALSYDFANNDTYGKLIRYESSIERGIYKALHELQRIQAARMGERPPLPLAVDIDLNNNE